MDSDLWLARLSDLLILQLERAPGSPEFDTASWRKIIRQRECTVRVWGYSHVFVYGPEDVPSSISLVRGLDVGRSGSDVFALQEVFAPNLVRDLLLQQHLGDFDGTRRLRSLNGHSWLNSPPKSSTAVASGSTAEPEPPAITRVPERGDTSRVEEPSRSGGESPPTTEPQSSLVEH